MRIIEREVTYYEVHSNNILVLSVFFNTKLSQQSPDLVEVMEEQRKGLLPKKGKAEDVEK